MKVVKKNTCWYNNNNKKKICSYVKIKKSMVYNKKIKLFFNQFILINWPCCKIQKKQFKKKKNKRGRPLKEIFFYFLCGVSESTYAYLD